MITATQETAFERWSFGEGWTAGRTEGDRAGFVSGYAAGFAAGAEVGGTRVLLGLEHALGGRLPDLLPDLPHAAGWGMYRRLTENSDATCESACQACSRCIRATAVATNTARYGRADFPGAVSGLLTRDGWL